MADLDRSAYNRGLVADILATTEVGDGDALEVFTERILDELEQAGEIENFFVGCYRAWGLEVSGYARNDVTNTLDLFVSDFRQSPAEEKLTKTQADHLFRRVGTFVHKVKSGLRHTVDGASGVHDMCVAVEKALPEVSGFRFFLLTNAVASTPASAAPDLDGLPVRQEIWDVTRFHRMATSGSLSAPVVAEFDPPVDCLPAPRTDGDYDVILAVVPGHVLADLYRDHGPRLLELNVRSFLQGRGAVNKGLRETILNAPERFLAYNNGITATASQVDFVPGDDRAIQRIHDMQIVNGGQTTASLHYVRERDRVDLDGVFVQMKLTVVSPDRLHEIVPEISKYSNTQNKVSVVDFSSNDAYHVQVERVTRSLWARPLDGSGQDTKWFYERARGQYVDAETRAGSVAERRRFKALHPSTQKFTKQDLAKYVQSWNQQPYWVSRGNQKNFQQFMSVITASKPDVDVRYCKRLVALAILFKAADRSARLAHAGSFKAAVTTYTVARLSHAVNRRLDLDQIWREQRVSAAVQTALTELSPLVLGVITRPRTGNHSGEWAKKIECWEDVLGLDWSVSHDVRAELPEMSARGANARTGRHREPGRAAGDGGAVVGV
ncbi:AIPR family protein [Embleya hyalina]|uniref:Abortive infection phage resistance protein n=1 Tax=Embleya hyalina TaxID=516124 RepID=A0A401YYJ5_9ACTN|nr:AIPR family protein [Embleya hyalina]GCD99653.1 hypothetical protein EHYA_07375 [Embleya hyalina]